MTALDRSVVIGTTLVLSLVGCDSIDDPLGTARLDVERSGPAVLTVSAADHQLITSADEVASGWTTIRFMNRSEGPHFIFLEKLPCTGAAPCVQKTVEDSEAEVVPVFQNFMDAIGGKPPSFPSAGFSLPAWFGEIVYLGGPGLTSPGVTSSVTVDLQPGTYAIECYVKDEDDVFHSVEGMIRGLVVGDAANGSGPPRHSSFGVTVSSTAGITLDGAPVRAGVQTFDVHFADQTVYAHGLGHDAHLVRLDPGYDPAALDAWMSWATPGGLAEPAPSGVHFLGGTQDMPAGSVAFVTARLEPGEYAWIAEVPDPMTSGLFAPFTVE